MIRSASIQFVGGAWRARVMAINAPFVSTAGAQGTVNLRD
jgi:hypothetical protein